MSAAPTRVLLVEDSRSDARLLEATLQGAGSYRFELTHVERLAEALAALGDGGFDVVLLDLHLPDSQGLDTLARLQSGQSDVPVVVLTGLDDEELAVRAVQAGAQDYLPKGVVDGALLARLIRHAVERHQIGAELERARAEQIRLRDRFLTHVSHELRTPLAAMHQFLDILADGIAGALSEEQQLYVERTLRNARQLEGMVAELLDAVRAQTGKLAVRPQRVDLATLVEDTVGGFAGRAAEKRLHLTAEVQPGLPAVQADPGRTGQVLGNLLDNAIKFTPEGGAVRVSAGPSDGEPGFVRVQVTDTGPGVPEEAAERIFERLWQAEGHEPAGSRKGLGLGLHICHELVTRQGGRIWVDPRPASANGAGATFSFTVPVHQAAARPPVQELPEPA
jgi:signal transduction histidine kinase